MRLALAVWSLRHLTDDVCLVSTELATNAIRHGEGQNFEVAIARSACSRGVRITVRDGSPTVPVVAEADPDAENGRGMQLVQCFANAWGVTHISPQGKSVWADISTV